MDVLSTPGTANDVDQFVVVCVLCTTATTSGEILYIGPSTLTQYCTEWLNGTQFTS